MNKTERKYMLLDIESSPDVKLARTLDENDPGINKYLPDTIPEYEKYKSEQIQLDIDKIKGKYKKQDTISKYIAELPDKDYKLIWQEMKDRYDKQIQMLAVSPPFAMIKLLTTKTNDELVLYENPELSGKIEKEIIETISNLIHNKLTGGTGIDTIELVTFNGKFFDIPVLIERGGIVGAKIPYRWLELIAKRGDKYGHYDLIENRSFKNTIVNKMNLNKNLISRFGNAFAKIPIDFDTAEYPDLKKYAIDELLKMETFYRFHCGMEHKEFYLKQLEKYKNLL